MKLFLYGILVMGISSLNLFAEEQKQPVQPTEASQAMTIAQAHDLLTSFLHNNSEHPAASRVQELITLFKQVDTRNATNFLEKELEQEVQAILASTSTRALEMDANWLQQSLPWVVKGAVVITVLGVGYKMVRNFFNSSDISHQLDTVQELTQKIAGIEKLTTEDIAELKRSTEQLREKITAADKTLEKIASLASILATHEDNQVRLRDNQFELGTELAAIREKLQMSDAEHAEHREVTGSALHETLTRVSDHHALIEEAHGDFQLVLTAEVSKAVQSLETEMLHGAKLTKTALEQIMEREQLDVHQLNEQAMQLKEYLRKLQEKIDVLGKNIDEYIVPQLKLHDINIGIIQQEIESGKVKPLQRAGKGCC